MIRKVAVRNYRLFRELDLDLSEGMNILAGRNDTGKSTLIEAITLALTGRLHGRAFEQELSPHLINRDATQQYITALNSGGAAPTPPEIVIEVYLDDADAVEILRGTNNLSGENACGIRLQAQLSPAFTEEYTSFISQPDTVRLVPTEYYTVEMLGFSGSRISGRSVPIDVRVIDASTIRLQSGVDYHLQQIIRGNLDPKERVELSRQYRSLREEFSEKEPVRAINKRLKNTGDAITDRRLSLSIDISQRYTWEANLVAHLDDLPFDLIGKGDQNALKTLLAIGQKADTAHVVLIEEPENHLSFANLRKLISRIDAKCAGKQVVIATHSTYVLNKLGIENLVLLGTGQPTRITDLSPDTVRFFKKLPGFDTLRLALAESAILVEGPSDELILQRAYQDKHGRLPIEDGIDVISVGLSHNRFAELAIRLGRRVWLVTDNDGRSLDAVKERFSKYLVENKVTLHTADDPKLNTLEPNIVKANNLRTLNSALGVKYATKDDVLRAMLADKTAWALAIFESDTKLHMPQYIQDVVN
ncbi:MAG: AAA family ATPase [Planctomycetes bacterium]|nr:AAA family ATPase [Planctomycetota bacterium]